MAGFWYSQGRRAGLKVIGAAQRPAIIDKTFFGLATLIHCGRLNYKVGMAVMDDELQIPGEDVIAMKPLEWIERSMQTGQTRRGTLQP